MLIKKTRIRSLPLNLAPVKAGQTIVFAVEDLGRFQSRLQEIGFPNKAKDGDTVLPGVIGPISGFNAEGKYIKHMDQPMETAYRQIEWPWIEWHGQDRVERSRIVDVSYKRYPRTFIPPPSVEVTLARDAAGNIVLVTQALKFGPKDEDRILHVINLLLEIFGECSVLKKDLSSIVRATTRRLNWQILPPGKKPWADREKQIEPIIQRNPEGNQSVIRARLRTIYRHAPEFVAVGTAGFQGYLVFGFPKRKLYLLESLMLDNATYVFEEEWETLSQLTKAEILQGGLQKERLIHREGWFQSVDRLFKP